jgi:hypothetical protein
MNIHDALYVACRELSEREASPTACVIESQSVKSAEKGASIDPPGYDAGKKIKGKKRHVLVDTPGLMLHAIVHPADIQDRDGGGLVLNTLFGRFPFLTKLFVDGGYQGPVFAGAAAHAMPGLWRKTSRTSTGPHWRSFVWHPFERCSEGYARPRKLTGQTLRKICPIVAPRGATMTHEPSGLFASGSSPIHGSVLIQFT